MSILSILICLLILGVWLFFAARNFLSATRETGLNRILMVFSSLCLALGALGFFGAALSAIGGLNWLPQSFEWPVGYANGVEQTTDNLFVVPHEPSGRIQLYAPDWKFIRGWHVAAGGGAFHVFISSTNTIHVITSRGRWHYVYSTRGTLLSAAHYPDRAYDSFPRDGSVQLVPTAPWLWTFTSPLYSWLVAMLGMVLLVIREKYSSKIPSQ